MRNLLIGLAGILVLTLRGCSTPQPKRGFELPQALREVYRGGELKPMQDAKDPDLGLGQGNSQTGYIPTNYDLVQHTCVSTPIYTLDGDYAYTSTKCW